MRVLALSLALLVLASAADAAPSGRGACRASCRQLQKNCRTARTASHEAPIAACADAGDPRACRKAERKALRAELAACRRTARTGCVPCCKLGGPNACAQATGVGLAAEPQTSGDPELGRTLLLEGDYMTCGAPYDLWNNPITRPIIAGGYGGVAEAPRLPGRTGNNADLPFFLTAFTAGDSTEVVNANCLMCHGGVFDGQLHVGLGNATADFTEGAGGTATGVPLTDDLLDLLGLDPLERAHLLRIAARGAVLGPRSMMRTIGMNPAEIFAVVLMVHHDRDTLAWSDTEVTPYVVRDHDGAPIADPRLTSDPPPWWRVHKKHALFYNGMARGDHRGTMALATSVCVDDVARATVVDEQFRHIQAYLTTLRAPAYPRTIDPALADEGRPLFERDCAGCHGTYGARDEDETYPNLLIPLDVVGTDPVVAEAGVVHSPELVDWYNQSFYGQVTRMVPNDPFPGYMPPPLDGIWATAPFLHNGSVPTIALVLNSHARPVQWKRADLDSTHFDEDALGWPWEATGPQADAPEPERPFIYDTSYWSQSSAGHPFGDHLTPAERRAVIEYLKTL
jgi:mono/diheme cytochrome c family protein